MQSFKSAVFTAFAALFLAASLSGCSDEGKTTSPSESSVFDSGEVKLVLKPGARFVYIHFSNRASAEQQREAVDRALSENGVAGHESKISGGSREILLFVSVERIEKEFSIDIDSGSLIDIDIQSSNGQVATWIPSMGNEVQYID